MNFLGLELTDFSGQYLRAALLVSLMSVWMLVGLFYYLNFYTKRDYFTAWTAAWLFYALWLTLGLKFEVSSPDTLIFKLKQCCVAVSAVFLLWGSLRFLKIQVRQTLFGLFILFLLVWTFAGSYLISGPENEPARSVALKEQTRKLTAEPGNVPTPNVAVKEQVRKLDAELGKEPTPSATEQARKLTMQLPVFILLGLSSVFAGICFLRLRKRMPFVGAGMLASGFLFWGLYLGTYPLSLQDAHLSSAGFFVAAVLQLFIAVSMIVLVLEEIRYKNELTLAEIKAVRSEKEALQVKVISTEEQCRSLYDQVRMTDGLQKAYEELRHTQQMVVQQERLRALGQMASGIAHDVNNALSPVVAYSDMLLLTLKDLPEESRHYLEIIRQAGTDIAQIVSRMREFYRRRSDTEPLVLVDINQTIHQVIELTRPRWRDISQRDGVSIEIESELEDSLPSLLSDPSELREALINLIFNAVEALPHGGLITLVTRSLTDTAPGKDGPAGRRLQVEVRDNGIGMDEKTRQRCLEPFFSTKTMSGGTGLGLAMVYGMVQRHEGSIQIESAPGRGTSILLTFPIQEKAAPTVTTKESPAKSKLSLNLLCIDDDEPIRKLLEDCLTHFDHRVTTATDGKQGLELFRAAQLRNESFEAVITDLGMPKMDGHQLARAIKAESPCTPIIMMTGWGTMIKEDGITMPEVDALLGKPPQIQELNELLLKMTSSTKRPGS